MSNMFNKEIINKIKLLNQDRGAYPDSSWLKKDKEKLSQFMMYHPVRKKEVEGHKIVEKVDFTQLMAQKSSKFGFLGLKLKPMTIIASILIVAILAGGGITTVQAQDSLPGETLYPVKLATEKVQLTFSSTEGDVKLHTKFTLRRVRELEDLVYKGKLQTKTELITDTALKLKQGIELSEKGLKELEQKGKDVTELALIVEEATSKHLEVLKGLEAKVPELAKGALSKAYESSSTGQTRALEVIIKAGEKGYSQKVKPLVEERIRVRLEQAKSKVEAARGKIESIEAVGGIPTPELPMPVGGEPVLLEVETKVKQINESIQRSETSLDKEDLPKALEEIKNVGVIIDEIETTIPVTPSESESEYIIPLLKLKGCIKECKYTMGEESCGRCYCLEEVDLYTGKSCEIIDISQIGDLAYAVGKMVEFEGIRNKIVSQMCPRPLKAYSIKVISECEDCVKEGKSGPVIPGSYCCPGLKAINPTSPEHNCQPMIGAFICTKCGNGVCGLGENICNCPEDCGGKTEQVTPEIKSSQGAEPVQESSQRDVQIIPGIPIEMK